jgi:two-component system C4-dicarboxylate transport sensor histidine kinase DctB
LSVPSSPLPAASPGRRRSGLAATALLVAAAAAALLWGGGELAARRASDDVREAARHRLEVYSTSLDAALEKFSYLPYTVSQNPDLVRLVAAPGDAAAAARVNDYLARVNARAGGMVLYVMRADGTTAASSNWDTPQSYVGLNFGFRPYFLDAMSGGPGHFYGVGVTTQVAGYFISAPVRAPSGQVLGVVAVKVSLAGMESSWKAANDRVIVTDSHGISFLASEPAWRYRAVGELSPAARAYVASTRQYEHQSFTPLHWHPRPLAADAARIVRMDDGADRGEYVIETRRLEPYGWQLMLFADAQPIVLAARAARLAGLLLLFTLAVGGLYLQQRRRRILESRQAQQALAQAHRELEQKVSERTADLLAANHALGAEVETRARTERELRDAQSELVQAGKMAVLGQMAAGVTHELNQPLTAMRSLADNAGTLLAQGRVDKAAENLQLIAQLVERMGRITQQLRNFSRKSPGDAEPVALRRAVLDALALLEQRVAQQRVEIALDVPQDASVRFEAVRLQQVLVNLLRNALDALRERGGGGRIEVLAERQASSWVLTIADNGPGIPTEALPHLFDPFFTTKEAGEGLGLGLPISLAIARDYGAVLTAGNAERGGARFILRMTVADE